MPRPKSFDRDAVLDQAVELFWERGYEGTSLADLETRLGLGRQSLYNEFGDKHALFLQALERYERKINTANISCLLEPGAGLKAIRDFLHSSVDYLTGRGVNKGCLLANTISELSDDPSAMQSCNRARNSMERAFRRALTHAKEQGDLPSKLDLEATASLLTIQHYGLGMTARAGAGSEELHGAVEALLTGLTNRHPASGRSR